MVSDEGGVEGVSAARRVERLGLESCLLEGLGPVRADRALRSRVLQHPGSAIHAYGIEIRVPEPA